MRIFTIVAVVLIVFSSGFSAMGQPADPGTAPAVPQPGHPETYFIKAGAGLLLGQLYFDHYNRPEVNGLPSEVDTTLTFPDFAGFAGSVAGGIEFPDDFSFYASGEWFTRDWAILANAQFTSSWPFFIKPYLFAGIGLDFGQGSLGPGGQLGVGLEYVLSPNSRLFFETKLYGALGSFTSSAGSSYSYSWADGYIPVIAGLKWSFPSQNQGETPTGTNGPGHAFVEIAGGFDTPAQNWQSAYTSGGGAKFAAGYEFKDGLALQMDVERFSFSGTNYVGAISDSELLVLPTFRYFLDEKGINPYLLAGVGVEFEFSSAAPLGETETMDLDAAIGAGIEIPMAQAISLFVETKYNCVFAPRVVGQDIPTLGGMRLGL